MTTTISAGAAAGLLVALMVMATTTTDSHGAEPLPSVKADNGFVHPGATRGFNPQPDPPRVMGDGSVRTAA